MLLPFIFDILGKNASQDAFFNFSSSQGILGIVWDEIKHQQNGVMFALDSFSKQTKMRWALSADNIEKSYNHRKVLSYEFANIMAQEDVKVYSLKGLSLSQYYPHPALRECGDFDCWMGDDFQRGNRLAIEKGLKFDPFDYRHSVINYKGLTIENHRYFLVLRGNNRNKRLERYLIDIIQSENRLENSNIFLPSSQFQAQFTILHMMHHFLYESLIVRHLLDWRYLVEAEKYNVDWREFNHKCEDAGVLEFVAAINYLCVKFLGLDISGTQLVAKEKYADKILKDTMYQSAQHVSNIENIWCQRYAKLKNVIDHRWKFNEIYDRGLLYSLLLSAYGMLVDRKVKF